MDVLLVEWTNESSRELKAKSSQNLLGYHRHRTIIYDEVKEGLLTSDQLTSPLIDNLNDQPNQVTSAQLAAYLGEMGVDPRLLEIAANTPPELFTYPDIATLKQLRVLSSDEFTPTELKATVEGPIAISVYQAPGFDKRQFSVFCEVSAGPAILFSWPDWGYAPGWLESIIWDERSSEEAASRNLINSDGKAISLFEYDATFWMRLRESGKLEPDSWH